MLRIVDLRRCLHVRLLMANSLQFVLDGDAHLSTLLCVIHVLRLHQQT